MKGKGKTKGKGIPRPVHRFAGSGYSEVVSALRYVANVCGRKRAFKILETAGCKTIRDLTPMKFPAVLADCSRVANYQTMIDRSGNADRPPFQLAVDRWMTVCEHELRYRHPELIES